MPEQMREMMNFVEPVDGDPGAVWEVKHDPCCIERYLLGWIYTCKTDARASVTIGVGNIW